MYINEFIFWAIQSTLVRLLANELVSLPVTALVAPSISASLPLSSECMSLDTDIRDSGGRKPETGVPARGERSLAVLVPCGYRRAIKCEQNFITEVTNHRSSTTRKSVTGLELPLS
jgi:hypothetical protein